jgi:tRNA A-37 threonylcarbamoyl transferase component Bud32/tetratricopeptide (TPR) repeat protein
VKISDARHERLSVADLRYIDSVCDRYEAAWRSGQSADLASFLADAQEELWEPLFRDLLCLDLQCRLERGEHPDAREYCERFPQLAEIVEAVFAAEENGVSSSTRRSSRAAASGEATVSLLAGANVSAGDDFRLHEPRESGAPGYEILEELGRGGMGVVYKARQIALDREVALKVIRNGGLASDVELLRFQNEAEAVAQLDHPQIVPIFEVGQIQGLPFFSMKLISGTSLDKRLAEFNTTPRASARIVAIVATALHHAHQRGILHRDLKPANILLDEGDEPHLTDFGLAKRIASDGELTQLTHTDMLMGTPAYMAPEQASQVRGALSTATDVYGLGTILYALFAGQAPFAGTTLVETLDLVRNHAPEPPSLINPHVPRELEIICLKCLEKEPARRYSSALAVAEDLKRWLDGVPILAQPVGRARRAWMWCRRNRALASIAALLVLAVLGGLLGVTWKWREAEGQRINAEALNELLTQRLLAQASPELDPLAKNLTVRELLDRTAAQLGGWLDGQPEVEARIRATIGGAYLSLGQYERAETHLRTALRFNTEHHGPRDRDTLRVRNLLATTLDRTHRGAEAETLIRRNLADCRRALGPDDPISLDAAERLGSILVHLGKADEAETVFRKNVDDRNRVLKPEHPDTLRSIYLLSRLLRECHQFQAAEKLAYDFAHHVQCSMGSNHPDNVLALTNQGDVLRDQGKLTEAEPYYRHAAAEARRMFGQDHPSAAAAANNHENLLRQTGRANPKR